MKKAVILCALLIGGFLFSQVKIPTVSSKGHITTSTDLKINYTGLVYEKGKVTFINTETGKEEFLYDSSVKSIFDDSETGNDVEKTFLSEVEHTDHTGVKKSASSLTNDIYRTNADYIKGKKLSQLGTGFLVGGGVCFLVGGILNLSSGSAETVNAINQKAESKGSPIPLIIGLAGMGAGLVMKISGNSQMKKVKNSAALLKPAAEYFVVTNNNGLGIKMKF
jgi:hypothetical protein